MIVHTLYCGYNVTVMDLYATYKKGQYDRTWVK